MFFSEMGWPMIYFILFICYCLLVFINTGFLLAYWQREWPDSATKDYRDDLALSLFLSLNPTFWIFTLFFTRFYEYGWMIRRPKIKSNSHVTFNGKTVTDINALLRSPKTIETISKMQRPK